MIPRETGVVRTDRTRVRIDRRPAMRRAFALIGGLAVSAGLGALVGPHKRSAVLLGALALGIGVVVADPVLVAVLAVPGTLLVQRLGGGAAGSSIDLSDAILFLGAAVALPQVRWDRSRALFQGVSLGLFYEGLLLLSVVANANNHALIEWGHRLVLIVGGLVAGWIVAASGRSRQAISVFLVGASGLALLTLEHAVKLHFQPAQWGAYQKNYIGAMMWMAVVIAHVNPPWAELSSRVARYSKYLCVLALLATQSKQSIIALVMALVVATLRLRSLRRRSKALLVAVGPMLVFTYVVAAREIASFRHRFNSLRVRTVSYTQSLHVWRLDIWLGQGPRWFYLPQFSHYIQPPNILLEALTDSGIVGVIGLTVMIVGLCRLVARMPREIGTVALVILIGRLVEGIFDVYWVSAAGALPFMIVGLTIGAADQGGRPGVRLLDPDWTWDAVPTGLPPISRIGTR